jgi:hypothetical protein
MFKSLFAELNRRNVIRVAGVYVVVAWGILQVANNLFPALTLPPGRLRSLQCSC